MDLWKPLFSIVEVGAFLIVLILGYAMGRISAGKPIVGQDVKVKPVKSEPFHDRQMVSPVNDAFDLSERPDRIPTIRGKSL